jgi:hypothetical protein
VRRLETEAKASLKEWVGKLEKANGKILEAETRQAAMKEAADAAKTLAEGILKLSGLSGTLPKFKYLSCNLLRQL